MPSLALLWLGLLLGIRHAADPDHVVAISAIAARTRRIGPATWLGIMWGLGHTLMLFVVASGIILFNWVVPPRLGLGMELCVAVALVVLGLANMRRPHDHLHTDPARGPWRAFFVGLVHGLAGSAAIALFVVTTVDDATWASAYLLVFGVGTLIGMMAITTGLALPVGAARVSGKAEIGCFALQREACHSQWACGLSMRSDGSTGCFSPAQRGRHTRALCVAV